MPTIAHLQVRTPKDDETSTESAAQIFSSLLPSHFPLWRHIIATPRIVSFEIYFLGEMIYYYIAVDEQYETLIMSLISSAYQKSRIIRTEDPMTLVLKGKNREAGEMLLTGSYYLPIKTYAEFGSVDPLAPLIGYLAKQTNHLNMAVQIITRPSSFPWQSSTMHAADHYMKNPTTGTYNSHPQKALMTKKASFQGGRAIIRLIATSDTIEPLSYLQNLAGTFGSYSLGEGNQLRFQRARFFKERLINRIQKRQLNYLEKRHQIFNAQELSTLWHPPGKLLAGVKNIAWGKTLGGEPPENLPTAITVSDDEKKGINFFARTEFRNQDTIFGIKNEDRRKHVYIIGKTGAGKSTLIANMAIDDIRKDRGMAIIDPHGDLSETILEYIPKRRMNDVVYLEPFDTQRPFSLNVLEIKNAQHKDLVASGIVSIFNKIYADSWGPRLEYILRNVIFTLLEIPNSTLIDGLRILSDARYRSRVVPQISDPVIHDFWDKEFAQMTDRLRTEAISPIQNKVGQFVSSKMVRNIIGHPKSTIDLEKIMNEGKILILNLSQGKFGEDNAALLGAMIITQIQLAAMNRAFMKEEERKDFFVYVDEFQNFATSSFIKILSEARKYRLALTLANQFTDQLDIHVQKAIFGNAGTIASFVVGAGDASILTKEFAEIYSQNDLVSLGKFETIIKLCIDNMTSFPFPARTLPLPNLKNDNKEKIMQLSKERYGRKVQEDPPLVKATIEAAKKGEEIKESVAAKLEAQGDDDTRKFSQAKKDKEIQKQDKKPEPTKEVASVPAPNSVQTATQQSPAEPQAKPASKLFSQPQKNTRQPEKPNSQQNGQNTSDGKPVTRLVNTPVRAKTAEAPVPPAKSQSTHQRVEQPIDNSQGWLSDESQKSPAHDENGNNKNVHAHTKQKNQSFQNKPQRQPGNKIQRPDQRKGGQGHHVQQTPSKHTVIAQFKHK